MSDRSRSYTFDPADGGGLLLGLRASQLGVLGAGVVFALMAAAFPSAGGPAAAAIVLVASLTGACWPIHGHPTVDWLPIAATWLVRRATGPHRSGLPGHGFCAAVPAAVRWPAMDNPARSSTLGRRLSLAPAGITVIEAPGGPSEEPLGVVRDRRSGTWAGAVGVAGSSFTLCDVEDQRRRLEAWGALLAGLARPGSPVARLQWVQRATFADPEPLRRNLRDARSGGDGRAWADYQELVSAGGAQGRAHETLLVVAVRARRGGGDPLTVLRRELRLVRGQLANAELDAGPPLGADALLRAVGRGIDPVVRRGGGVWPLASDEAWAALRIDDGWHATYWVAEWPRVEMGPDFLVPLLLAGTCRAVSVIMAPVPPARATREVESARTAAMADDELRRRAGFLATARRQRQAEGVARREAELADGHAEYRFSGYVTVSGTDRSALDQGCAEIEHAAQNAHLDLRRLWGRQAEAFTWTLPLGRGLA